MTIRSHYLILSAMFTLAGAFPARAQQNSEQIIFSGGGTFAYTNASPGTNAFGFWIWCESAESSNPYHGLCNGAMYFYGLGLTKHVAGGATEISDGVYQMSVVSTADDTISCTLTNSAPAQNGPKNTIPVKCTSPAGSGWVHNCGSEHHREKLSGVRRERLRHGLLRSVDPQWSRSVPTETGPRAWL
jgi:hypothetical protein